VEAAVTDIPKAKRGFALMDPEKRRAIQAKGGRNCPPEKRSFSKDRELASRASVLGGRANPKATTP
jgi:uncharacterized protein